MSYIAKDQALDRIAESANVAQFLSYGTNLVQRFGRMFSVARGHRFLDIHEGVEALISRSAAGSVNVRSFSESSPKSNDFIYGLQRVEDVVAQVKRLATAGFLTIVNETIDVGDGGVSGVVFGDALEFAPKDTPRAVERAGAAAFGRDAGLRCLSTVYGFEPELDADAQIRTEFSIHPIRHGFRRSHTIIWEAEHVSNSPGRPETRWPNRFSRFIGDKAFGLLVAHLYGFRVPRTTVIARGVAPFTFGDSTGTGEVWLRTCPVVLTPGKFSTTRGWVDPFRLLNEEDPSGEEIASVLSQEGVEAAYSGAALALQGANGPRTPQVLIEGTDGFGDEFMVGRKRRVRLPEKVESEVRRVFEEISAVIGPGRFEWVFDGREVWIVQLHRGTSLGSDRTIVPGAATEYIDFHVQEGLEALRALLRDVRNSGRGVRLVGDVGVTSHFGDVLRQAAVPSFIVPEAAAEGEQMR